MRSDLYSLGCTCYELLTGKVPFPVEGVMSKLLHHQTQEAAPVERLRPEVPAKVAAVVRRLMAKAPADRYQMPVEVADALEPHCRTRPRPHEKGPSLDHRPGFLRRFSGHDGWVTSVSFTPDGTHAVSGGLDGTVRLWDLRIEEQMQCFTGQSGEVWAVAVSPDGRQVLAAGGDLVQRDYSLRLGDLGSGRELGRWQGHEGTVLSVAFSESGRWAASGGLDGTVRFWDVPNGREVAHACWDTRIKSTASPSGRSADCCCPAATIGRCVCGTWPAVKRSARAAVPTAS